MNRVDDALALFSRGYNCAQAVFAAYGPSEGIEQEQCLMIASTFGGGLGRQGDACGAVTGALMALGMHFGRVTIADPQAKAQVYAQVADFIARFKASHGSITCRELLGCDLSTPEGRAEAAARNLHLSRCTQLVRDAAEILEGMLD